MTQQRVDLYQPIYATRPNPPVVLNVGVPNSTSISEGVPSAAIRPVKYVLISALPDELKHRVQLAIDVITSGF